MSAHESKTVDDLIDALTWHNCAGICNCDECKEIHEEMTKRRKISLGGEKL